MRNDRDGLLVTHLDQLFPAKFRVSGKTIPFAHRSIQLGENAIAINGRVNKKLKGQSFPERLYCVP